MGQRGPIPHRENVADIRTGKPPKKPPPPATSGRIVCPHWLDSTARYRWKALAPALIEAGRLTSDDVMLFAVFCETYANWTKAQKVLQKEGFTYLHPNGCHVKRPEVEIAQTAASQLKTLGAHFGLTPAGRLALPDSVGAGDGDLEGLD